MIITRTPFRVSFVGGGSDLPSFYKQSPGMVISTTIDKYIYLATHPNFDRQRIHLQYSRNETCASIDEIQHPVFRECLRKFNLNGVVISSNGDIPAGTGMGSSSAFTVGLLHNLYTYTHQSVDKSRLAAEAADIEMNKLAESLGKQDHYAASCGGLNLFQFNRDESVLSTPLNIAPSTINTLERRLLLFYTGTVRSAYDVLREQAKNHGEKEVFALQKRMVDLVQPFSDALYRGNLDDIGGFLHESWQLKKKLAPSISNPVIDAYYSRGCAAGAIGGKLLGAGGGGFLLFYCLEEHQPRLRKELGDLFELSFRFEREGSKIIYVGNLPETSQESFK